MAVSWVVAPCRLVALMMEAVQTSETLVKSYQSTRLYNPEDSHLHSHRREDLKSYIDVKYVRVFRSFRLARKM
jgi:hypothetical protein